MSISQISSVSAYAFKKTKDIQEFLITKKQPWDGSTMVAIWKNREMYDSSQMKILHHLIKSAKLNSFRNTSVVTYGYPDTPIGRLRMGRLVAKSKGSLERVKRIFRHSLCANLYFDIDMINAQPVILSQLAKRFDVDVKNLQYYTDNREAVLQKLIEYYKISREEAKEWIIKCLFGAKIPELNFLREELEALASVLGTKYPVLFNIVDELRDENKLGTFLAYIAQSEECKCLLAMNHFFESMGRSVCVLAYDGCMILKLDGETVFPQELLLQCEDYIYQMTQYKIKLSVKQMKVAEEFANGPTVFYKEEVDDKYMTQKFINLMGNRIKNDIKKGILLYDNNSGLWVHEEKDIRPIIVSSDLIEHVLDGIVNYSGFVQKQDLIIKQLPALVKSENFIETAIQKSIGKLLFSNGIYDMVTKTFTDIFDPSIYFCGCIPFDFPTRNYEIESHVNKIFFEDPFLENEREVGIYLKKLIARGIGGYYNDKSIVISVGSTDSGKSKLFGALQDIFAKKCGTFNMNAFRYQKNSTQDEAKKNSWILSFYDRRCAFGSETSKLGIFDSNTLKTVVSGGDRIVVRSNFVDEYTVYNMATLFLACNDIPTLYPLDTAICNRIKLIEYKLTFVANPTKPYERQLVDIDALFAQQDYKNALIWILLDSFESIKPTQCSVSLASAKEWVPNPNTSIRDALENNGYTIDTSDDTIYVPFSELKQVLVMAEVAKGMSDIALGRELTKLGLDSHQVKVSGKKMIVRKFIKHEEFQIKEHDPQI